MAARTSATPRSVSGNGTARKRTEEIARKGWLARQIGYEIDLDSQVAEGTGGRLTPRSAPGRGAQRRCQIGKEGPQGSHHVGVGKDDTVRPREGIGKGVQAAAGYGGNDLDARPVQNRNPSQLQLLGECGRSRGLTAQDDRVGRPAFRGETFDHDSSSRGPLESAPGARHRPAGRWWFPSRPLQRGGATVYEQSRLVKVAGTKNPQPG